MTKNKRYNTTKIYIHNVHTKNNKKNYNIYINFVPDHD